MRFLLWGIVIFFVFHLMSCSGQEKKVAFPVKVSENKRYLTDQNGVSFFIHSDTPWSLFVATTKEDAEFYLEDRRLKGFNSITVNLIEHWFNGDTTAYPYSSINKYGQPPFLKNLDSVNIDLTAPNEEYFNNVDYVISLALQKGILVMMTPAYTGYIGLQEGWYRELIANGPERCREYGRFLGKRYNKFPNIIWIMDGDRNPDSLSIPLEREIAAGICENDTIHLFSSHCHPSNSSRDHWEGEPWLELNAVYTYNWKAYVHEKCLDNYQRTPVMPCFLFETCYENEHKYTNTQIRAEMYWGWLCTIAGQQMGNKPIWHFGTGWKNAMNGQSSMDAQRLKKLVDSRPWYNLVPDFNHEVLVKGIGEGESYVACSRSEDGSVIIAYLPLSAKEVTIDMTKVSGKKAIAWWYNPATAEVTEIGVYPTTGSVAFIKDDKNDMVLVIDDLSRDFTRPGLE